MIIWKTVGTRMQYYIWNQVELKVYKGRPFNQPFRARAHGENILEIRKAVKQFIPRLEAVSEKQGGSIKMLFG